MKIAYIGAGGAIAAALITGAVMIFSSPTPAPPTSNTKVIVRVAPSAAPPSAPATRTLQAPVTNLASGQCAYVFSEPKLLDEDRLGCVYENTTVYIYCTVESQTVVNSTVWDEIYFRTAWGTTGYVPDYYVNTGTTNAAMPSCV